MYRLEENGNSVLCIDTFNISFNVADVELVAYITW